MTDKLSKPVGKRFGLPVFYTWCKIFKANSLMLHYQPLTQPRTDEELAEFMGWEFDFDCTVDQVRRMRNDFNAGRLTNGVPPHFISKEWKP